MSDGPQTPAATGSLAKTPFAHVILYLYRQRASGTLILSSATDEYRVLFQRGRAIAAHAPQLTAALDRALLPLTALATGEFEFHEADLVGSGSAVVTGMFDPIAFVVEATREHARPEIVTELLAKYADGQLALDPATDLSRLGLTPDELRFCAPLQRGVPLTLDALIAQAGCPRATAERLAYTLLITRALAPATQVSTTSLAPQNRPRGVDRVPSRPLSDRLRPSGDAWRAIASRAAQIASGSEPARSNESGVSRSPAPERVPQQSTQRFAEVPLSAPPEAQSDSESRALRPSARTEGRFGTPHPRRSSQSQSLTRPVTQPIQHTQVTRPISQPIQHRAPTRPITQPLKQHTQVTRPISQSLTSDSTQAQRRADSRPLTPSPYREGGSGSPRVSPRPSLPDVDTLDSAGKFRRVELLCQRNSFDDALPIMRGLLDEERKNPKYLGMLSHVLLGRTSTEETIGKEIIDAVNQALRLDPDQVHALYTKARCYKRLGKEREALHYFRRTVAVEPAHLDAAREVRLLLTRLSDKRKR